VSQSADALGEAAIVNRCINITTWLYCKSGGDMAGSSDFLLERIADRLKAMADPMRLKILHVLQN
jgi:hypothetical protein